MRGRLDREFSPLLPAERLQAAELVRKARVRMRSIAVPDCAAVGQRGSKPLGWRRFDAVAGAPRPPGIGQRPEPAAACATRRPPPARAHTQKSQRPGAGGAAGVGGCRLWRRSGNRGQVRHAQPRCPAATSALLRRGPSAVLTLFWPTEGTRLAGWRRRGAEGPAGDPRSAP